MIKKVIQVASVAAIGVSVACASFADSASLSITKSTQQQRYAPAVWVDPDGCEHWAMDDGVEGYMTPHVTRDGIPVCRRGNTCAVMNSDQLFQVDKAYLNGNARARLQQFFTSSNATTFLIDGHTDSDASDGYNMSLSKRRAEAVAKVAASVGKRAQARWYGERVPVASNRSAAGKSKNRRVEITCIR